MSLSKGLVLHMPLEQELYNSSAGSKRFTDKSAQGNHGLSANAGIGFAVDRMGQSNRSTVFDGTDYIDCGNDSSLNVVDAITVSCWINTSGDSIAHAGYVTKLTQNSYQGWAVQHTDVNNEVRFFGFKHPLNEIKANILLNEPNHVIGSWDGTTMKIYVGGVLQDSRVTLTNDPISTNNLYIGRLSYSAPHAVKGSMADVRIYNRALSTTEIELLYQSYRPKLII